MKRSVADKRKDGWDVWCTLEQNNTLTFGEGNYREGGDIIWASHYKTSEDYLEEVISYMEMLKTTLPKFYNNILQLLVKNGFKYEQWRRFISVSDDFLWPQRVNMTKEEIEKKLGYKINIV